MLLKICGLKDPENIKQVAALKPDFMGFIFYDKSKRFVGEDFVMPLISPEIKKVGVFVNANASYIVDKIDEYKLDLIQLHGDEKPEFCEVLNHIVPIIKAFAVDETFDLKKTEPYKKKCSYFLFDTKTKEYGGSGKQFDWNLLEKYDNSVPFFLSGGIYAVDVNSKFESNPGVKDVKMISDFKLKINSGLN